MRPLSIRIRKTIAPIALTALMAPGCGDDPAGPEPDDGPTRPAGSEPVASVAIEAETSSLTVGERLQLAVVVRDADGDELEGRAVGFATSNPRAATVSDTGLVRAVAPGEATITATSEGRSGIATFTIAPAPVSELEVRPSAATIEVGETVRLTPTPRTASGDAVEDCDVTASSEDASIARAESAIAVQGGRPVVDVTGVGAGGPVAIRVTADCGAAGQVEASARIDVVAATARIVGAVVDAVFGFGLHSATVTIRGPVDRETMFRNRFRNQGGFEFFRLTPGTYTVTAMASFDIDVGRITGTFVADCGSVTLEARPGATGSAEIECAFPPLTGAQIDGRWSGSVHTGDQSGSCPAPLATLAPLSMTFGPGEGTIEIGLFPTVVLDGPYDPATGAYRGEGTAVLADGSSIQTTTAATFGFIAFDPIFETGYIFSGEMTRSHRDANGNTVCTEVHRVTASPVQ